MPVPNQESDRSCTWVLVYNYFKKKNTILSYNIAENIKRVERNEEKVCVCVCMDAGWCLVSTLND